MCGRYYMDEETYLDIQKIVSEVEVSFWARTDNWRHSSHRSCTCNCKPRS